MPATLARTRALPTYLASNGGAPGGGAHAAPPPDLGATLSDPAQHSCNSAAVPSQLPPTTSNLLHTPPIRPPLFPPSFRPRYTHIDLAPRGAALGSSVPAPLWEDPARAASTRRRSVAGPLACSPCTSTLALVTGTPLDGRSGRAASDAPDAPSILKTSPQGSV